MANTNDSVLLRPNTVGMDMAPPYAVYVDGIEIAQHATEREASAHFNLLRGRKNSEKFPIVVAEPNAYLETVRAHAGTTTVVVPYGVDWTPVMEAEHTLEAMLTIPLRRLPI